MVHTPSLLFRTMSTVHVEQLNFKPMASHFVAALLPFAVVLAWQGRRGRSACWQRWRRWAGAADTAPGMMIVTASLPMGANVFPFARRHELAQDQLTVSMAVSTVLCPATLTLGW